MFLSGFAGLGYEIAWTRMLAVGLGHEIVSVLAVIAAFFAGLALGAWGLDRTLRCSNAPGRWYALLEAAIGTWALSLVVLIPIVNRYTSRIIGLEPSWLRHWAVSFLVPLLILLPATFAMGATLPAIERLFSRLRQDGRTVGGLYAANTLGAVGGTLITTFAVIPALGFRAAVIFLAGFNFLCAAAVALIAAPTREARLPAAPPPNGGLPPPGRILPTLFVTGLLGIGYEVLMVRTVNQVLENTVYSFASLLAVYLLGTAAGAAVYQRWAPREQHDRWTGILLSSAAMACLAGALILWIGHSQYAGLRRIFGGGTAGSLLLEMGLGLAIFFPPTLVMGALFSHLAQAACSQSGGLGRALCVNTVGAALGPLVFGVIVLPHAGSKASLLIVSLAYLMLMPHGCRSQARLWAAPLALSGLLILGPADFRFITLEPGQRVVRHREGVMAAVTVTADRQGDLFLRVDDKFIMGGTSTYFSDRRQGHIPLLLHPDPRRALFLGLGTGATFSAASLYPRLHADGVELIPEIIPLLSYFDRTGGAMLQGNRLRLRVADARRFVQAAPDKYDVIVADLYHPARDGAGSLYTVEHFRAIRSLLNPGGLFCQWLPLYQMDLELLRLIVRSYLQVYPHESAFLAHYSLQTPIVGLIGGAEPLLYRHSWPQQHAGNNALAAELAALRLGSLYELLGCFIAGPAELAEFAGEGPINTDDRPLVNFQAPRFVYAPQASAATRLTEMLGSFHPLPAQILRTDSTAESADVEARLKAYWEARDEFLRAGLRMKPTADPERLLADARGPLLAILRRSPDFTAAYDPLLAMAEHLSDSDPGAARELLLQLESIRPQGSGARKLHRRLHSDR